ncbi:MAG: permease prefix domain 1-containing protein, partial [Planctomycetota bacterium]
RVPKADAQRIRDELEDHLRARVDDLMVTGQSEPEAVRLAVAELGETAELARSFAAARTSPRRRLLMQTTVLAAAGIAIVTGSTALLSVQGVPSSSQPAIAQADAEPLVEAQDAVPAEPVFPRDLRAAGGDTGDWITIGMAVELIEEVVGKPIMANYPSIFAHAGGPNVVMSVDHLRLKGLTLSRGIEVIGSALGLKANDVLVLQPVGDSFELGAQSFFDRRDATLIEYDLSAVLSPPDGPAIEPLEFQNTVTSLIEPTVWGGNARVGMVSRTMLVYAPPRIHSQINDLLKRVDARYTAYRDAERVERRAKLEQQVVDFAAEIIAYETRISEIQGEIGRVRSERGTAREMLFEIEVKSDDVNADQLVKLKVRQAEAQDVLTVTESQMFDLERRLSNMKHSRAVTRGQLRSAEKSLQQLDEAA